MTKFLPRYLAVFSIFLYQITRISGTSRESNIDRILLVSKGSACKSSRTVGTRCYTPSNVFGTTNALSALRGGSDDSSSKDLPTIQAFLVPRNWSIPHVIRLIVIFSWTIFLSESLRSIGVPYQSAVRTLLYSSSNTKPITPLDEYMAQLIAHGRRDILPPKHMPSAYPLFGAIVSALLYVFGTILFPRWFLSFHVWLNYQRFDLEKSLRSEDNRRIIANASYGLFTISDNEYRHLCISLKTGSFRRTKNHENVDYFTSNLLQRRRHPIDDENKKCTGISLLIQPSQTQSDKLPSSSHSNTEDKVFWLYFSEDFDSYAENKSNKSTFSSHPLPYYFEWDQRRIYVDFTFEPHSSGKTRCYLKYKDGRPDFFQLLPVNKLVEPCLQVFQSKYVKYSESSFLPALSYPSLQIAKQRFGKYNNITLPVPSVRSAFIARVSSPLSVVQSIGRLFTALEENFFPVMFNIGFVWLQHYFGAKQSVAAAKQLVFEVQGETKETAETEFWVLRPFIISLKNGTTKTETSWIKLHSSDLLPGDLFFLPTFDVSSKKSRESDRHQRDLIMPVDALILDGSCVTREAVITGEAVAQSKVSIELSHDQTPCRYLDIDGVDRNSILFAGTTVISSQKSEPLRNMPKDIYKMFKKTGYCAVPCLALRTGSSSTKGEIVRALSNSGTIACVTSTHHIESDSLRLIFTLSSCALLACASLFFTGPLIGTETVSTFRRVIQVTRIITASIPSDLSLALASVVQTCSSGLRKEADVVCSDAVALVQAAEIDTCVWDKTGTLTEDTQALTSVIHPPWLSGERLVQSLSCIQDATVLRSSERKEYERHPMLYSTLVGCHSLRFQCDQDNMFIPVGDPLDIACLTYRPYDYVPDGIFSIHSTTATDPMQMKKLWQLKTFPFDPNRRCSSALVLILHNDNRFRIWLLIKGSPETLISRCSRPPISSNISAADFRRWYDDSSRSIGRLGMRIIALGAKNVSSDNRFAVHLFPDGLHSLKDNVSLKAKVRVARKWAKNNLERNMIEGYDSSSHNDMAATEVGFDFVGFCCFEAAVRQSTRRVVTELKKSGVQSIVCTGDGVEAASTVANLVGISNQKNLLVLQLKRDKHQPKLFWIVCEWDRPIKEISFRKHSIRKLYEKTNYCVCLTGEAFLHVLDIHNNQVLIDKKTQAFCSHLLLGLHRVKILARASPTAKELFVTSLRKIGRKIIFCGDGVNDVKALRKSDLSVALLNGYATLPSHRIRDVEDDRRRETWHKRSGVKLISATTLQKRFQSNMKEVLNGSGLTQSNDILSAFIYALRKEVDRSKRLHEGGAKAAQILARDDLLVKSNLLSDSDNLKTRETGSIKSGEACLAAKFTCLRPCVDGIETIIRYGIAASAFSLTLRRVTFLNCLMACFHLATLYRNGFRYGKYMWNIELFLAMALDKDVYKMSTSPRPRVSILRPSRSIFHFSSLIHVINQAIIHIFILSKGVNILSSLSHDSKASIRKPLSIKFSSTDLGLSSDRNTNSFHSFMPRVPFRPSLSVNVVFIFSIYQNVMIVLTNHLGSPFQENILECTSVVVWSALSILLCVILVMEEYPMLNRFLELAPWPSNNAKLIMILLLALDGIGSWGIRSIYRFSRGYGKYMRKELEVIKRNRTAADNEVRTLTDERKLNRQIVWSVLALIAVQLIKGFY